VNMPVACGKKTDQKIIHSISQEVAAAGIWAQPEVTVLIVNASRR
jgi:hypothetical protein